MKEKSKESKIILKNERKFKIITDNWGKWEKNQNNHR